MSTDTKLKITPGPWHCHPGIQSFDIKGNPNIFIPPKITSDANPYSRVNAIAEVSGARVEAEANARAIAAAPDLLEALEGRYTDPLDAIEKLVRVVREHGHLHGVLAGGFADFADFCNSLDSIQFMVRDARAAIAKAKEQQCRLPSSPRPRPPPIWEPH